MDLHYELLSYMAEQLLYPLDYPHHTKYMSIEYFKHKKRILKYRIIKIFLISILLVLLMKQIH